jgi:transcriptional regulator with XRE-family HTH domain
MAELAVDVGLQILAARIKKGLKQSELADLVGTSQPAIARAERGGALQSLDLLLRIAEALGTGVVTPTFESLQTQGQRTHIRVEISSAAAQYKNPENNYPASTSSNASKSYEKIY